MTREPYSRMPEYTYNGQSTYYATVATWLFPLEKEQYARIAEMIDQGTIIKGRQWHSWEEFVDAHQQEVI